MTTSRRVCEAKVLLAQSDVEAEFGVSLFVMHYIEFKAAIQQHLKRKRQGATWIELRETLVLPYDRPCPEWTRRLEEEIGLIRRKGTGRALVWELQRTAKAKTHV